jgi:hypothetical protein
MEIEPTVFGRLLATLFSAHRANEYGRCIFDHHEEASFRSLWMGEAPTEFERRYNHAKTTMIGAWVNRLYLANQIATALNYQSDAESFTLHNLPDGVERAMPYTASELYEEMNSIHYNLFTNAGRCMFSHDDMERLNRLISLAAYQIIRERDRT